MKNNEEIIGKLEINKSTVTAEKIVGVQIGLNEEEMLGLFEKYLPKAVQESVKSALPSISEEASRETLMKMLGEDFLKSFWMYYLVNHISPLYKRYGTGKGIKIALIGEGFGPIDEITKAHLSLKEVIPIVSEGQENPLNLVPITVVNAIAPESEIYYLKAIPGYLSDLIKALDWCVDNQVDIVAILGSTYLCEDGSCLICEASKKLVLQGNIAVVSPDQVCPKSVLDGIISVGSITPTDQGVVLLRKNTTPSFAKVLAWAKIQACTLTTLIISNTRPLVISNVQDLTSDGVSVGNVCGLLALVASYLKRVKGKLLLVDLEKYLKKCTIQVSVRFEEGISPKGTKCYGLLEPTKLLE